MASAANEVTLTSEHRAKQWVVVKFGGTSVSYGETWKQIVNRVNELQSGACGGPFNVLLVLSALTQVTNRLEKCVQEALNQEELSSLAWIEETHRRLAKEVGLESTALKEVLENLKELDQLLHGLSLLKEQSPRIKARICAFGERLSTILGIQILKHHGLSASLLQAGELLVSDTPLNAPEDDKFLNANVTPRSDRANTEKIIQDKCGNASIVVTQGFVGRTVRGETCLLGRGGSDTSGSLMAALLQAHHYEIWTDVYGMFSGDPRKMPHARLIKCLGSRQAQELATCGAKVLHPRCIMPAALFGIPIEIHNTMDPSSEYTKIDVDDMTPFLAAYPSGPDGSRGRSGSVKLGYVVPRK